MGALKKERGKVVCVVVGVECAVCDGRGWNPERRGERPRVGVEHVPCSACGGKGHLTTTISTRELRALLEAVTE